MVSTLTGVALAQTTPVVPPPAPAPSYPPSPYPPPPPQQTYPPPPPRQDYPPTQQGYPWPPQSYPPQQASPQGYPPPSYPPGAYPPPPAGYAPPPHAGYQAPYELPYRAGQPIPSGYRLVEEPRYGLVTAGYLVAGIPYGLGLVVAMSTNFDNGTEWLAVPFVGPWLTMGQRNYHCDENPDGTSEDAAGCLADVFVVMGLLMDGLMQAGGGALLLTGYLTTKKTLVREDLALSIRPIVGSSAWGFAASGRF